MERTSVSMPRSLARRVTAEQRATGRSASAIVRDALESYFAQQGEPGLPSFTGTGDSGRADTSARTEELVRKEILRRHRG